MIQLLRRMLLGACFFTPFFLSGCGTGEYKARMDTTLAELNNESSYLRLLAPNPMEVYNRKGYGIRIRRPLLFDDRNYSAHIGVGLTDKVPGRRHVVAMPSRYVPPFLGTKQPGTWPTTWQAFELLYTPEKGDNYTFYGYFAFVPAEESSAVGVQDYIATSLKRAFPEAELQWEDVTLPGPEGRVTTWKKIAVNGEMPFDLRFLKNNFQPDDPIENQPARMVFYLATFEQPLTGEEEGVREFTAVVGWRAPMSQAEELTFFDATEAAMGTISVAPQGEDKQSELVGETPADTAQQTPSDAGESPQTASEQPSEPAPTEVATDTAPVPEAREERPAPPAGDLFLWQCNEEDEYTIDVFQDSTTSVTQGDVKSTTETHLHMYLIWKIADVFGDHDQHYSTGFYFHRIMLEVISPEGTVTVDTGARTLPTGRELEYYQVLRPLIGKVVGVTVHNYGGMGDFHVPEETATTLTAAEELTGLPMFTRDGHQSLIQQALSPFPQEGVPQGGQYQPRYQFNFGPVSRRVNLQYTYTDQDEHDEQPAAFFQMRLGDANPGGENENPDLLHVPNAEFSLSSQGANGHIWFNNQDGHLIESVIDQSIAFSLDSEAGSTLYNIKTHSLVKVDPLQ